MVIDRFGAHFVAVAYERGGDPGDANGDGELNMKDVLVTRIFIASIIGRYVAVDSAAADVNGDNSVDMKDVLTMRKMIAGLLPVSN